MIIKEIKEKFSVYNFLHWFKYGDDFVLSPSNADLSSLSMVNQTDYYIPFATKIENDDSLPFLGAFSSFLFFKYKNLL